MTPILSLVMGMLQNKNPQMFQNISQAMNSGQNPQELVKQIMGNMKPEQRESVIKQAKDYGCPSDILTQIQNIK